MYSVHQHWDPLKVCVVGRSYPPEFYSWIKKPAVRSLFERMAIETEEDYQNIIKKLESFGVEILRPEIPANTKKNNRFLTPPMMPRDFCVMVGSKFYVPKPNWQLFYSDVKDSSWPDVEFDQLPTWIQDECVNVHGWNPVTFDESSWYNGAYKNIIQHIRKQGNEIKIAPSDFVHGAYVSRIGKDLYFGTEKYSNFNEREQYKNIVNKEFSEYRNHIVNTGGHGDGTYCPVTPGLIISLYDVPTYEDTFPGWEVIYLPGQSWKMIPEFTELKKKNDGKWWIPGFEHDQDVVDTVEQWLGHWTGYVEETVFDVNMLIVDPKNVLVFNYNKQVFDALDRYGITPHVVPFRHRYFWDGGIHCVTLDLHRTGIPQDYFPGRL